MSPLTLPQTSFTAEETDDSSLADVSTNATPETPLPPSKDSPSSKENDNDEISLTIIFFLHLPFPTYLILFAFLDE